MNLLLVNAAELGADGDVTLADRRARHLRDVLDVAVGATVRTGIVGGDIGTATVTSVGADSITLRFQPEKHGQIPLPVDLVLAIPRPKVITRTIEIAASFGVRRIDLTNAWRVDKSYLGSPRLAPDALAFAARFGAEQGATTHIPPIQIHNRFMAMLDAMTTQPRLRLVAHPGAPPIEQVVTRADDVTLAIGPEGGWIERELETLVARGFSPVSLGEPILRVEAAVASALAQLSLLRRLRP